MFSFRGVIIILVSAIFHLGMCYYHETVMTYYDLIGILVVTWVEAYSFVHAIGVFVQLAPIGLCLGVGWLFFLFRIICGPWFNSLLEMLL